MHKSNIYLNLDAYVSTQVFMFFNREHTEGSELLDLCGNKRLINCELTANALSNCNTALYKGICLAISRTTK